MLYWIELIQYKCSPMLWSKWYLINNNSIRRYRKIGKKTQWERYPKEKYAHMSPQELESFLRRLNADQEIKAREAKERYNFDHSYWNQSKQEAFYKYLVSNANSKAHIQGHFSVFQRYVLYYFITVAKLPHPNHWIKKEAEWGEWLLKKKLSANSIKRIKQVANRSTRFLAKHYPGEVNPIILEPVGKKKLNFIKLHEPNHKRFKFVDEAMYLRIYKAASDEIKPYIFFGYRFGLRISEVYPVTPKSIFKGYLSIEQQLVSIEPRVVYGPLKNRQVRKVPYWFTTPAEAYSEAIKIKLMHPHTVSRKFVEMLKELELSFQFHDLRRSFITKAVRVHNIVDVQRAAGHYDIKTTMVYVQDDRKMDDELFIPDGGPDRT